MNPMNTLKTLLMLTVAMLMLTSPAAADNAEMDQLKERFKQRFPVLVKLKEAGKVGEVHTGYADAVQAGYMSERTDGADSPTVQEFLALENNDRRRLYALIAEQTNADANTVAQRNAARNFENAKPHWFIKPPNRDWTRKQDL